MILLYLDYEYSDEIKKMLEEKTREYIDIYLAKQIFGLIDKYQSTSFELDISTNSAKPEPKYNEYWIRESNRFFYEDSMKEYRRRLGKWVDTN